MLPKQEIFLVNELAGSTWPYLTKKIWKIESYHIISFIHYKFDQPSCRCPSALWVQSIFALPVHCGSKVFFGLPVHCGSNCFLGYQAIVGPQSKFWATKVTCSFTNLMSNVLLLVSISKYLVNSLKEKEIETEFG